MKGTGNQRKTDAALESLMPVAVNVETAAALMSVSRAHVFRLIARGELRTVKSGARRLVPLRAIEEWMERQSS